MSERIVRGGVPTPGQESLGENLFTRFDSGLASRMWAFVRPHRAVVFAALGCIGLFTLVQVGIPLALRHVIDSLVGTAPVSLEAALLGFLSLVLGYALLQFLSEWLATRVAQRVIFDLRRAMFIHLHQVPLGTLERTQVGRLMARLQGDVGALQEFLENAMSALGDLFLLLGIVVVLLLLDLRLGLLTLSTLPLLILARALWIPWAKRKYLRAREASSSVNAALAENINGVRTVQENRREAFNFAHYRERAEDNLRAQIGSARASQIMVPAVDLLTGVALAVVLVAGSTAILSGSLGIGGLVAYIFFVQRFFDPIRTLSMQYTMMQRAAAAAQRVFEVLDLPLSLVEKPGAVALRAAEPSIEWRNVTFAYRPGEPVLHGINLRVEANRTVAIVGPTGSGKSSLAGLLQRFYDPDTGEVLIAGQNLREVSLASLGQNIGVVLQEPFLFSGSILDNIRYGCRAASREAVIAAARTVHAHDFIMALADGYDTLLGQRGRNLSVGQRQLLSFARALLADPRILILDEATANIDSQTELAIQDAMKTLLRGRTSLVIAHRLTTVRHADLIVVMQRGRIVEQGNHEQLLARGGLYSALYFSSLNSFEA